MNVLGKVCIQIPARAGSKRVKAKNLRLIDGKPMLQYAVEAALASEVGDVYVNSDSQDMLLLGEILGAKTYRRPEKWASDEATGDDFTYDFLKNVPQPVDTLIMVSPVCPLVTAADISNAVRAFQESNCDTLISCDSSQMQVFCDSRPVNIRTDEALRPSQENAAVQTLNWAVTIWKATDFIDNYESRGYAYLGRNRLLYEVPKLHTFKVSEEQDFELVSTLIESRNNASLEKIAPRYWSST